MNELINILALGCIVLNLGGALALLLGLFVLDCVGRNATFGKGCQAPNP